MRVMAEIGHILHWPLSDLLEVSCEELVEYHAQAVRISKGE